MKIFLLSIVFLLLIAPVARAQDNPAIDQARHTRDLLVQENFDAAVTDFNRQMSEALTPERLRQVWTTLKQQFGEYKSEISAQAGKREGYTSVMLGMQFERAALNMAIAFDSEGKVAGLQFVPR